MATEKKRKGKKGSKGGQPDNEPEVASVPSELVPPVLAPETEIPKSETVKVVRKTEESRPARVSVVDRPDPKAKREVVGKVSINFRYGPEQVCLIAGKKTRIPAVAFDHCRRLGYL